MILIGRNVSPFVRRVAALMRLLEIDFEQRFLATADSIDDIAKYNPLGRVPSLVLDNDEILIDSSAIIKYLFELYLTPSFPWSKFQGRDESSDPV
mgnify:CR=1 FL=1